MKLAKLTTGILSVLAIAGMAASPLALPGAPAYLESRMASDHVAFLDHEPVPLSAGPGSPVYVESPNIAEPDLSKVASNQYAAIDASLCEAGIVSVTYKKQTGQTVKCVITHPDGTKYNYTIRPGETAVFTLTGGDGKYKIRVMEQTAGNRYIERLSYEFDADGILERAIYTSSCLYIDYDAAENAVALANSLSGDSLETIDAIYQYVARNVKYDDAKAASVTAIYAPDLDETLESGKGICMDYAALAAGMLRSRGIPCRMLFGDMADGTYHAWIEVYSEDGGWLDKTGIWLSPGGWTRLDPTISSGRLLNPVEAVRFITDDKNYDAPQFIY